MKRGQLSQQTDTSTSRFQFEHDDGLNSGFVLSFSTDISLPLAHVLPAFLNYQLRRRTFCFWMKRDISFKSS